MDAAIAAHGTVFEQRAGDLVLIPPEMWHAVYHHTATAAVAGQFASRPAWPGVLRHVGRFVGSDALAGVRGAASADAWTPARLAGEALRCQRAS